MNNIHPIHSIHQIHQIQTMDRQSVLDRITTEYNDKLYEIQKSYDTSKKILDDKYSLTIKQINAIYDAYEVTLWQLAEYKNELLKEKLLEFPNLENSRLNTSILYIDDKDYMMNNFIHSIKLNFDIFACEYSILEYCSKKSGRKSDLISPYKGVPFTLLIKLNNFNNTSEIWLNNIKCEALHHLFIEERDIVILWKAIPVRRDNYYCINIIKLSTGELIYSDKFSYAYDKDIYHGYIQFIYCNRQIMCYYRNKRDEYIFSSFTIDETLSHIKVASNCLCILRFQRRHPHSRNMFYGDDRGLYLNTDDYIYFIGKLDKEIGTIDLHDLDKLQHKIKLEFNLTHVLIDKIDYATYKIHIRENEENEYVKYIISLGVSDLLSLLY